MNKFNLGVGLFLLCGAYSAQANAAMSVKDIFYNAAVQGRTSTIRYYLSRGYNIDAADENGVTAMCQAKIDRNTRAYNTLVHYGANPKGYCNTFQLKRNIKENWKWYALGGAAAAGAVAGLAAAFSSGGGGGGGGGGGDVQGVTVVDADSTFTPYSASNFTGSPEYTGQAFKGASKNIRPVNFLASINAASAFSKFYGTNSGDVLATTLQGKDLIVGVMDTGVHASHKEFRLADGSSKVFGHNFDYGPCNGSDTTNCWKPYGEISQEVVAGRTYYTQAIALLDANGNEVFYSTITNLNSNPYTEWASDYPSDYDWDNMKSDPTPSSGHDTSSHDEFLHGTNVAGIIAANWNRSDSGMMGVAFSNTKIDAIRWDFKSSFKEPFNAFVDDGAYVVNLSLGNSISADKIYDSAYQATLEQSGWLPAMRNVMSKYKYETIDTQDTVDGMIIVKSAGNDNKLQPDIKSATKLLSEFSNLQMLVVVAVDVAFNDDGSVRNYKKSSFSNACGITSGFCISAPGGSYPSSGDYSQLYSAGDPVSGYIGMAGTSQAAPVVTGSIAFLKNAYPYMKSSQIIELIRVTANTSGEGYNSTNHTDATYGAGLLDLGNAVSSYVPVSNNSITTFSGNDVNGSRINLSDSHLNLTSSYATALKNALPEKITAFDRYNRPFAFPTDNYITATHSGYKTLKNDVANISRRRNVKQITQNNISFAYSEPMRKNTGFGFMNAEYKHGKNTSGFYFSENTKYDSPKGISSELNNPFMSFDTAYGMHNTYDFNKSVAFRIEAVSGRNGLYDGDKDYNDNTFKKQAYGLNSELLLHKDKNFAFGFSAGMLYEDEAVLGMNGKGAMAVSSGETYNSGVKASWFANDKLTFSGSYYQGYTKAQKFASNLLKTSNLVSDRFAFDINYRADKSLDFGLTMSSPLRINKGSLAVDFPSGRDNYSDTVYRENYKAGLKPDKREYKFAAYANKDVSENLSLRSEFDVRVNPEHQDAANDYRALLGMSYNF